MVVVGRGNVVVTKSHFRHLSLRREEDTYKSEILVKMFSFRGKFNTKFECLQRWGTFYNMVSYSARAYFSVKIKKKNYYYNHDLVQITPLRIPKLTIVAPKPPSTESSRHSHHSHRSHKSKKSDRHKKHHHKRKKKSYKSDDSDDAMSDPDYSI